MNLFAQCLIIWISGWILSCVYHYRNKALVKRYCTEESISDIDKGGLWQYAILFFSWAHYLFVI